MVKSKNKKSVIALVVMAFLLVASIVLAATGAWFTDQLHEDSTTLNFGKVDIAETTAFAVTASNTIDTTKELMPGSKLVVAGVITNNENPAWIAYKLSIVFSVDVGLDENPATGWTYDSVSKTLAYETKATAVAEKGKVDLANDLSEKVTIPTDLGNKAIDATATIKLDVIAVQQANTGSTVTTGETTYSELVGLVTSGDGAVEVKGA